MADQAPTVFGDATTTPAVTPAAPVATVNFEDKLKVITGPDGKPKYATVDVALDALSASQVHIARLEQEAREREAEVIRLREIEKNAATLDTIVDRLQTNRSTDPVATPTSGLDENSVVNIVRNLLSDEQRQAAAKANLTKVNDTLVSKFGDKASEVVAQKAKELGTTPQELGKLSSSNPQIVLQLFGTSSNSISTPTSTSIHIDPTRQEKVEPAFVPEKGKSLLSGLAATDQNRKEVMAKIRDQVYKQFDVTT